MVALLAVATLPLFCDAASAADGKRPAAAAAVKPAPEPTGAELVGKMLSEQDGPSNPDVPLPQYGLSQNAQPNLDSASADRGSMGGARTAAACSA